MTAGVIHTSHWGAFYANPGPDGGTGITPHPGDRAPSAQLRNLEHALQHPARVLRPAVRQSWLENGPGARDRRIGDPFVEVSWDQASALLAQEITRVRDLYGPGAVYGGSYGWASAGRFHHAQSQIHRFLNVAFGGFVNGISSYSAGAASPLLPRILCSFPEISRNTLTWEEVAAEAEMILVFGGMPLRNSAIGNGSVSDHIEAEMMARFSARGGVFHLVSPLRDDLPGGPGRTWHPIRPGTDTALMLAMAFVLQDEGLADEAFLNGFCTGYEIFRAYLTGAADGGPKTPAWAERLTGIPASRIAELARDLVARKSLIVLAHALQRAEFGEQTVWAAVALAAMAGQIGLPGRGFSYSFGSLAHTGRDAVDVPVPTLPQGQNLCQDYIPVATIADALLNPGAAYGFMGEQRRFPDLRLAWWAGGNPFHHHQDLRRLSQAFSRLETFVVQEQVWTATAKTADIVLPVSFTLEREDFGCTRHDQRLFAMQKFCEPAGEAKSDYDALSLIARALGPAAEASFTEGRSARDWLAHLWQPTREALKQRGVAAPEFEDFWAMGSLDLPLRPRGQGQISRFRKDPARNPLSSNSGRVELFSAQIAALGLPDAPGHPVWRAHSRLPDARYPFFLIANAPAGRLHSQLDFGATSQADKVTGREALRLHPRDAEVLGITTGDLVRVENDIGACLAGALVTEVVMPGVVHLQTGAWYDPQPDPEPDPARRAPVFCAHGNANVLLPDLHTSALTHGCAGQIGRVALRRWSGPVPVVTAFAPPPFVRQSPPEPRHD